MNPPVSPPDGRQSCSRMPSLALMRFSPTDREARFMLVNTTTLYSPDLDGRIDAALAATRAGIPVILLDDFDRENEAA
jgi:hypothetical protein